MTITDILGYCASLGVLGSFFMKDIKNLRMVNTVGCLFFVIYGIQLHSYPVILTNAAIICINFYYLFLKK